MTASTAGPVARASVPVKLFSIVLAGAAVSIALGVYGRVHDPTGEKPYTLFFSDTINLKVWFASAALLLAVRTHGLPNWLLPVVGGTVFATLVLIWTTSAVWFWREFGFPSF